MISSESDSAAKPAAPGPDGLDEAFQRWRGQGWRLHTLALVLLTLVGLARFWAPFTAPYAPVDESLYEDAFQAIVEGRSPYEVQGYYYPTVFAVAGSWLTQHLGTTNTRRALRAVNLLGLVVALWLAAAWWRPHDRTEKQRAIDPRTWIERFAIAGLLLVAAPGIREGFTFGNSSFLTIGLALPALAFAGSRPLLAAPTLALSVALKPIGAAIFPLLVLTPPRDRAWAYRLTGVLGGTLTLTLWLGFPYFSQLLAQNIERLAYIRTWSAYRLADVLGLGIGRLPLLALIVLLAVMAGRWARASHTSWLALAVTASVLATPLIWGHTLVMAFPVIAMAGSLAVSRRHRVAGSTPTDGAHSGRAWVEPWFVAVGCGILLFYNAGAIDDLPRPIEALLLLIPVAGLVALTAYVIRAEHRPPR